MSAADAQSFSEDGREFERVLAAEELPPGARRCVQLPLSGRSVMLLNLGGSIYCMDQACYHHGGPLLNGDIEEMGGKTTIKCPWHAYRIALDNGEGLYMGVDMVRGPDGKFETTPPRVKSKGVKQRVHEVRVRDGAIFVADSSKHEGKDLMIQSDIYAFRHVNIPEPVAGEVRIHSKFV